MTPLPPQREILEQAFGLWGAEARSPELLGGSNCWVYALDRADGKLALRLTPDDGPQRAGQVQAELDWLCYLAGHGAPVCAPSASLQGRLVEPLAGEHGGGG